MDVSAHALFVIGLIVLALVLFATERIRLQATAFLIFVVLLVGFSVWPYETADGVQLTPASLLSVFGNQALITVCALMVLGKGIETTRALQPLVGLVSRNWAEHPRRTLLSLLVGAAVFSAFLNNTPIVVVLLPVLITIAQKNRTSPSKLLLPLGLATIVGGMATTIGTSTNLLVVDLAASVAGMQIKMFAFTHYVVVAGVLGIGFLWLVAPAITPHRETRNGRDTDDREYMATLVVEDGSALPEGATVADFLARTNHEIAIDRIKHGEDTFRRPLPSVAIHSGDQVFVRGTRSALKEAELELKAPLRTIEAASLSEPELEPQVMEILVTERSELDRRSMRRSELADRFGVVAVALHRPDAMRERSTLPLNRIRLRAGDILLCEGTKEQFDNLLSQTRLLALNDPSELPFTHRSGQALAIVAIVILVAALDIVPISVSAIAGVGIMIATKCIGWRHVGQSLSTQVILVIVVSLALGEALMATGGDQWIASLLADLLRGQSAGVTVMTLMFCMAVLTNVVSNNAAAVIGTPIGIQLATQLGIAPEPMVLAVLFGANLSFATPIGYQTNLLVLSAGGYKFGDFLRVGVPLSLLMWVTLSLLLIATYSL